MKQQQQQKLSIFASLSSIRISLEEATCITKQHTRAFLSISEVLLPGGWRIALLLRLLRWLRCFHNNPNLALNTLQCVMCLCVLLHDIQGFTGIFALHCHTRRTLYCCSGPSSLRCPAVRQGRTGEQCHEQHGPGDDILNIIYNRYVWIVSYAYI